MNHQAEMLEQQLIEERAKVAALEAEKARGFVPDAVRECAIVMRGLSLCDKEEIESDDAEIWLEDESGRDGGYSFSITEFAGKCADILESMIAAAPAPAERCDTCCGHGEVPTGETQRFGDLQPPEPIMMACPECEGHVPAERVEQEPVPDEVFEAEFQQWWEDHGQLCRSGGSSYEKSFAFEAWRYLYPKTMKPQPSPYPATSDVAGL